MSYVRELLAQMEAGTLVESSAWFKHNPGRPHRLGTIRDGREKRCVLCNVRPSS